MNREKLAVFKRMFVSVLGALGLGALAVGTAFAQSPQPPGNGNIPAPDLFDKVIACTSNVPTLTGADAVPMPAKVAKGTSDLKKAIEADREAGTTAMVEALRTKLLYVVPNTNCGGTTTIPAAQDQAKDVAEGYREVMTRYDRLIVAERALKDAEDAATSSFPNTAAIATAQTRKDAAQRDLDAVSKGPVYQAAIAEWRAKGRVESALAEWQTAAEKAATERGKVDTATYRNSIDLVDNTSSQLIGLFDADGNGTIEDTETELVSANLNEYVGITDAGTPADDNDNYSGGKLQYATYADGRAAGENTRTGGTATDDITEASPRVDTVADMRTRLTNAKAALAALNKFIKDNPTSIASLNSKYEEAVKRANLEVGHHQAQLNNALASSADARSADELPFEDTNGDGVKNPAVAEVLDAQGNVVTAAVAAEVDKTTDPEVARYSVASRQAAYNSVSADEKAKAMTLDSLAMARETATKNVIDTFTHPGSFYEQLVERRTALKAEKEKIVADAGTGATDAQKKCCDDSGDCSDRGHRRSDEVQESRGH